MIQDMRHVFLERDIKIAAIAVNGQILGMQPPPRKVIYGNVDMGSSSKDTDSKFVNIKLVQNSPRGIPRDFCPPPPVIHKKLGPGFFSSSELENGSFEHNLRSNCAIP